MKTCGKLIIIIYITLLAGCSAHKENPGLQFLPFMGESLQRASENEADRYGIDLSATIYATGQSTAYLYGVIQASGVTIRSVLMLSEDGGQTWQETMTPIAGGSVVKLLFLDKRIGWVVIDQVTRGRGKLLLYMTADFGKSWQRVSSIPRRRVTGRLVDIGFLDRKNGRIGILYEGTPHSDGLVVMTTSDGGVTWTEVRILSLEEYRMRHEADKLAEESEYSLGDDGSQWKLAMGSEGNTSVLRRFKSSDEWDVRSIIPAHYSYSNGRIVIPDESQ